MSTPASSADESHPIQAGSPQNTGQARLCLFAQYCTIAIHAPSSPNRRRPSIGSQAARPEGGFASQALGQREHSPSSSDPSSILFSGKLLCGVELLRQTSLSYKHETSGNVASAHKNHCARLRSPSEAGPGVPVVSRRSCASSLLLRAARASASVASWLAASKARGPALSIALRHG